MKIEIASGISIEVSEEKIKELVMKEITTKKEIEEVTPTEVVVKRKIGRPRKKPIDLKGLREGEDYKCCVECGKIIYKDESTAGKARTWKRRKFCSPICKGRDYLKRKGNKPRSYDTKVYTKKDTGTVQKKIIKKAKPTKAVWTADMTRLLKKHKNMKRSELADLLGLNPRQVSDKFTLLGIKRRK